MHNLRNLLNDKNQNTLVKPVIGQSYKNFQFVNPNALSSFFNIFFI
jgi:hypothetical protein